MIRILLKEKILGLASPTRRDIFGLNFTVDGAKNVVALRCITTTRRNSWTGDLRTAGTTGRLRRSKMLSFTLALQNKRDECLKKKCSGAVAVFIALYIPSAVEL